MGFASSYVESHIMTFLRSWTHSFFSADYMQGTRISFSTKESAINFAEKQGTSTALPNFPCLNSLFNYSSRLGLLHVCSF